VCANHVLARPYTSIAEVGAVCTGLWCMHTTLCYVRTVVSISSGKFIGDHEALFCATCSPMMTSPTGLVLGKAYGRAFYVPRRCRNCSYFSFCSDWVPAVVFISTPMFSCLGTYTALAKSKAERDYSGPFVNSLEVPGEYCYGHRWLQLHAYNLGRLQACRGWVWRSHTDSYTLSTDWKPVEGGNAPTHQGEVPFLSRDEQGRVIFAMTPDPTVSDPHPTPSSRVATVHPPLPWDAFTNLVTDCGNHIHTYYSTWDSEIAFARFVLYLFHYAGVCQGFVGYFIQLLIRYLITCYFQRVVRAYTRSIVLFYARYRLMLTDYRIRSRAFALRLLARVRQCTTRAIVYVGTQIRSARRVLSDGLQLPQLPQLSLRIPDGPAQRALLPVIQHAQLRQVVANSIHAGYAVLSRALCDVSFVLSDQQILRRVFDERRG